jgi:hypothetical protein
VWKNTVVEVHQAGTTEGPLWYHVGTIANGVVAWGPSRQYDNGLNPSIAFSNEGYLVEVHQAAVGTSALWYHVGTLGASQSVNWSASYNYDTGNFPTVACGAIGEPECTTGCNAGLVFDARNSKCAQASTWPRNPPTLTSMAQATQFPSQKSVHSGWLRRMASRIRCSRSARPMTMRRSVFIYVP